MKTVNNISQDVLKQYLRYDPMTGIFTWIKRIEHSRKRVGDMAGCPLKRNGSIVCIRIGINKTLYRAHRLAWLYMYGSFPINDIDHKDGDPTNNKLSNLRDVTRAVNNTNRFGSYHEQQRSK